MKKIIAILAVLMLVPFTAFGLEALSEDVLDDVTGQAGVSIAIDVTVNAHMDTMAWGDDDGIDDAGATTAGWVGMTDVDIVNLRIKLHDELAMAPQDVQLFTIDVATDSTSYDSTGDGAVNETTYVRIGLGTMQITMEQFDANVVLGTSTATMTQKMGEIRIDDLVIKVGMDSRVDIFAHQGSGVTFDIDINIDTISMSSMSWGDTDGIGAVPIAGLTGGGVSGDISTYTTAGYIGMTNFNITELTIDGQVKIDVATLSPVVDYAGGANLTTQGLLSVYAGYKATGTDINSDNSGNTAVLIQLDDLQIGMESMSGNVVLGDNADLMAGNTATLGSFYVGGVTASVDGWVAIFAH